jgi:hypothetical protein
MIALIILWSVLLAVFMKIADNINDHGLKWFKRSNILFGFLWGLCGAFLIFQDPVLMNVWLAIILGWIVRAKIDKVNHGIAVAVILIPFLFNVNSFRFKSIIFIIFFTGMIVLGFIHDYLHHKINKTYSELFHSVLFYTVLPLIVCIIYSSWNIFISLFSFVVAYDSTRFYMLYRKMIKW